ncbi:hypothetical protein L6164_002963 [Bauhinia variegata]|uniref:Uncharacterized protein n=1 Tax=Bauhinia variegata TaxID=167791 RepID=A0ACB9PZZ7_BAUVA|nr:hypothetical protein L6164_002963 [Bauhinia variegata]
MLEIFTRKKPTDDMFSPGSNLKGWVTISMPNVAQIVDPNLLEQEAQHFDDIITYSSIILELALKCCADLPEERISIKDAVASLNKIKVMLLQKARPRET